MIVDIGKIIQETILTGRSEFKGKNIGLKKFLKF